MKILISLSSKFQYEYAGLDTSFEDINGKSFQFNDGTQYNIVHEKGFTIVTVHHSFDVSEKTKDKILDYSIKVSTYAPISTEIPAKQRTETVNKAIDTAQKLTYGTHNLLYKKPQSRQFLRYLLTKEKDNAKKAVTLANGHVVEKLHKAKDQAISCATKAYIKFIGTVKQELQEARSLLVELNTRYENFSRVYRYSYSSEDTDDSTT